MGAQVYYCSKTIHLGNALRDIWAIDKVLLTEQSRGKYGLKSYYKASEIVMFNAFSDVHFSHYTAWENAHLYGKTVYIMYYKVMHNPSWGVTYLITHK